MSDAGWQFELPIPEGASPDQERELIDAEVDLRLDQYVDTSIEDMLKGLG